MKQTIVIRVRLEDWAKLRRCVRAYPNETMSNYFDRIACKLEVYIKNYGRSKGLK